MNQSEEILKKIKRQLKEDRLKTNVHLKSLIDQDPYADTDRLTDNSIDTDASEESSHERMEAMIKELKLHLTELDRTLEKIENGCYGKCITCGKIIDSHRLTIKPTALNCVDCERKAEV